MRLIDWDDELATKTYNDFKYFKKSGKERTEKSINGFVGEALVEKHFNQPIVYDRDHEDDGWDMIIDDKKYNIKCAITNIRWFGSSSSLFSVNAHKGLLSDYYLFCQMDPKNKQIALCGYLSKAEVILLGRFYKEGSHITETLLAEHDFYSLQLSDLHPINAEREF